MASRNNHLEEVLLFIREHRSNESNFEKLCRKLEEESNHHPAEGAMKDYVESLREIKEKQTEEYTTGRENRGSAWPEFENFVAEFERAVTGAMKAEAQ